MDVIVYINSFVASKKTWRHKETSIVLISKDRMGFPEKVLTGHKYLVSCNDRTLNSVIMVGIIY